MTSKAPTKPGPPLRIPRPQPGVGVVGTYQSVPPGYHLDLRADGRATYVLSPAAVDAAGGWRGLTARGTWRSVQGTHEVELTRAGAGAVRLPRRVRATLVLRERGLLLVSGRLPGEPHRLERVESP